jgi:hypothetical protein
MRARRRAWSRAARRGKQPPSPVRADIPMSRRTLTMCLSARAFLIAVLVSATAPATSLAAQPARPLAVDVVNASEPESCAEKDNITVLFSSDAVRRLRIEASHPAYIGAVKGERREPDWTDCGADVTRAGPPPRERRVTFYESPFLWVTGYEFSDYWRRRDVPVKVGERVEHDLTMVQVWMFVNGEAQQVLVLYPTDGIWRMHPLHPPHLAWTSYGSSFFVGPVTMEQRPVVEIKEVVFDPATKTFHLALAQGGAVDVKLGEINDDHAVLDIAFDRAIVGKPFAALRSMYVTEFDADVARIALQRPDARSWLEQPIMEFKAAKATKAWMGRLVPSRHNMSAPDMVFGGFSGEVAP